MIFKAYARQDGAYVLVPDCLIASREAERCHGPLRFSGQLDSDTRPDGALWRRVLEDIDRQAYAVVRAETGRRLLAASQGRTQAA